MKKKVLFVIICCLFFILIGLFVFTLTQMEAKNKEAADTTKYFGLMNNQENEESSLTETEDKNPATLPIATKSMGIKNSIQKYLSVGDFEGLDKYLMDLTESYQIGKDAGITTQEIESIRADLAVIDSMTSYNAPTLMKSFRNSDVLASAMVFCPLSCKYKSMYNVDSLMVPVQETTQVNLSETELSSEEFSEIMGYLNRLDDNYFTDIKQYRGTIYGAEFDFIVAYSLPNNAWMPYIIRSSDERANIVFKQAQELQRMVDNSMITEETMDTALSYNNLDDIDLSVYEDNNIQTFKFAN